MEALEDFNINKEMRSEAIPYHNKENKLEIHLQFQLEQKEIKVLGININEKSEENKNFELGIIKKYPNDYFLSEDSDKRLGIVTEKIFEKDKQDLIANISNIFNEIKEIHAKQHEIGGTIPALNTKI